MIQFTTKKLPKLFILLTIVCAPLYMVRFVIVGVPSNVLEVLMVASIVAVSVAAWRQRVWCSDTTSHRVPYVPLFLWRMMPQWWRVYVATLHRDGLLGAVIAIKLIILGALLSTWAGGEWRVGLGIIKGWFILPFLFMIAVHGAWRMRIVSRTHIFRALIVGGALIALTGLLFALFGTVTYDGRLSAFYLSPNHLAMALAPIVPLALGAYIIAREHHLSARTRFFLSFTLPLLFLVLFLTRSFGGMLAGAFGALSFLVCFYRSCRVLLWSALSAFATCSIVLLLLWQTPRVQDFFTLPEHSSLASRTVIWHVAWDIGANHPLLGIGPGNFQDTYLAEQKNHPPYPEWAVPQPHNLFLAFWLQTGIIGLSGFAILLFVLVHQLSRILRIQKYDKNTIIALTAYGALFAILLHGLIDTPYWKNDLAVVFWLLIFLALIPYKKQA